jgi:hypothetical protein
MAHLTLRGAKSVTADLDKLANLVQFKFATLGLPAHIAKDFATKCDVLSDHIDRFAKTLDDESEDTEEEGSEKTAGEVPEFIQASVRRYCEFFLATDGRWYIYHADDDHGDLDDSTAYGPFRSEDEADFYVRNYLSTSGASDTDDSGNRPPPTRSPNGTPLVKIKPQSFGHRYATEWPFEEKKKKASQAKVAVDETGDSVEPAPGNQGFDANDIADETSGPLEILPPADEPWMNGHFTQARFQQLRDKQTTGQIGFKVSASVARIQRLASIIALAQATDRLRAVGVKLASTDAKALVASIGKQVTALDAFFNSEKLASANVLALGSLELTVDEQVTHLASVAKGKLAASEVSALVDFGSQTVLAGLKAAEDEEHEEEGDKEAGEVPEAFKKNWDKGSEDEESDKKSSEMPEFIKDKIEEKEKKDKKTASDGNFGYPLFD